MRKTLDIWNFKADRTKELLLIKGLASWEYVEDLALGIFELVVDKAYAIRGGSGRLLTIFWSKSPLKRNSGLMEINTNKVLYFLKKY